MKEPRKKEEARPSESITEFRKRMESIEERLDQADRLFDNMQDSRSRPVGKSDKAADTVIGTLESLEIGIKRFFSSVFSQTPYKDNAQEKISSGYAQIKKSLPSCSLEELKAIRDEIDKILKKHVKRV